jgi:alkanesulfonate monooxygenase SsuD/methylene tetrahydromethanopterin reductase-like flavin-dependent oxidoreductase (luciferase family)
MTWALTRPFAEVEAYMQRFEDALAAAPGMERPRFMTMRHTGVYAKPEEAGVFIEAVQRQGRMFENLFRSLAPVVDGFPQEPDPALLTNQAEYVPENLLQNLMLGSPEEVTAKLKAYEALGVDHFCYNGAYGLPLAEQKKSLRLFIDEVLPAFQAPVVKPIAAE